MGKPKFEDYRRFPEKKSDNYLSKLTIQIVSILQLGDQKTAKESRTWGFYSPRFHRKLEGGIPLSFGCSWLHYLCWWD
jgi:hypothetical protein